ncbi:MAG: toprim domain-containing protein [archaeon]
MKFNPKLKNDIEKFRDSVILVEGKNDVSALKNGGFDKVYAIHKTGVGLRERIEEIVAEAGVKEKYCVLTDLDKQGKKLYVLIRPILVELGVKVDSTLRGLLISAQVSHMEGFEKFMGKVEKGGE